MKRTFDVVVSAVLLFVLAPYLAVLALLVRSSTDASVIFRQVRIGKNGRPFAILKFCTITNGHVNGPIGAWLRRWKQDELLQLINVLRGEMSMVGPRPLTRREAHQLGQFRLLVQPGLTGSARVGLMRDEEYIFCRSFALDLYIMLRTPFAISSDLANAATSTPGSSLIEELATAA